MLTKQQQFSLLKIHLDSQFAEKIFKLLKNKYTLKSVDQAYQYRSELFDLTLSEYQAWRNQLPFEKYCGQINFVKFEKRPKDGFYISCDGSLTNPKYIRYSVEHGQLHLIDEKYDTQRDAINAELDLIFLKRIGKPLV